MEKIIYNRGEVKLGLQRMLELMELLGNPQNKVPIVHIAGTNGKGSTGTFIRAALSKKGIKAGHYQTPAVFDPMEIISIDGENISASDFDALKREIDSVAEKNGLQPTKFEIDTAIAFLWFAENRCDIAVIEAGLGGDTDATNVSDSTALSVITPIGYDHMEYLGTTLSEIATHKAGIMRKGIPAVTAVQQVEVMNVLESRAEELGVDLSVAGSDEIQKSYQEINSEIAIKALEILSLRWPELCEYDRKSLLNFFEKNIPFGRFYTAGTNPLFIIDGAHNVPAAKRLRDNIDRQFKDRKILFVTGAFSDKEYVQTIENVVKESEVYTLKAPGNRGLASEKLAADLREQGIKAISCESVCHAVECACERAKNTGEIVIAFGSLSWLKEAKESYDNWKKNIGR